MDVLLAMPESPDAVDPWRWPAWATAELRQRFPAIQFKTLAETGEAGFDNADVVIGWTLTPAQLARSRRLRWLHAPSSGIHQLLFPELVSAPLQLTHGARVHGNSVAEHALALLLAMVRQVPAMVRDQLARRWRPMEWGTEAPARESGALGELRGHTVVLVGLGAIGERLAPLLHALGMHVVGVRRQVTGVGVAGCDEVAAVADLERLLPRAEVLVLAVPVTAATRRLINRERLALLPQGARLVNVGRGELLDEAALVEALAHGRLAGAALDVFQHEPLPSDSPLWTAPGLLLSPHVAGMSAGSWRRQLELIDSNLRRYLAGEELEELVDKHRGY